MYVIDCVFLHTIAKVLIFQWFSFIIVVLLNVIGLLALEDMELATGCHFSMCFDL